MKNHPIYAAIKRRHDAFARKWAEQARTDPEYGGANFQANLDKAKGLIRRFGTPALFRELNETGMGNNPELLRFVWRLACEMDRRTSETKPPDAPKPQPQNWGRTFYPKMPNP